MTEQLVTMQRKGSVQTISLSRSEKRNALTRAMIVELSQSVTKAVDDPLTRVIVLAAEGQVFCAGMDLGEMKSRAVAPNAGDELQQDSRVYRELVWKLIEAPVPTVAAVGGPALAGGMGLVLACDMVVCAETAFFSLPEPQRGITAAMVTPLLTMRVGAAAAGHALLSGERIPAQKALQMGLCVDVVTPDDFDQRVHRLVTSILQGSPQSLALTKQHLYRCASESLSAMLDESLQISGRARETEDAQEGLAAFLEKRAPRWQEESML